MAKLSPVGRPWVLATSVALVLAIAYLIVAPPAADLAAATYRSDLFARVGFATWDTGWYAAHGHWLPAYSLLAPALGALLGVRLLLVLSALAASLLFGLIAERIFGRVAGRPPAAVFALGFCVSLLSGRVPFDLGFAIGLGSLLALLLGRVTAALVLAALTSLASPVAGAFLALAGLGGAAGCWVAPQGLPRARAYARAVATHGNTQHSLAPTRAWPGLASAGSSLAPILALSLAYPEGGYEPFAPSAFWPALAAVIALTLALPRGPLSPRAHRAVRAAGALYALALVGAFALHTPMGGNAARLGPLLAAPMLVGLMWGAGGPATRASGTANRRRVALLMRGAGCSAAHAPRMPDRRRVALLVLAPALLYWQLVTPIRDLASIAGDPSVHASYYAPLLAELRRLDGRNRAPVVHGATTPTHGATTPTAGMRHGATIVEIPLTRAHWEAAYVAGHDGLALARGWERQLDTRYAQLFYGPTLAAPAYRGWLLSNRVAYVALPDVPLDRAGRAEGRLIAHGVPYLREIWRSRHWRLFGVMG